MDIKQLLREYPRTKGRVETVENDVKDILLTITDITTDLDDLTTDVNDLKPNAVADYRSEFESDEFIYSGFLLNLVPVIKRCKDGVDEFAQGVTDLETDWTNRLSLIYV